MRKSKIPARIAGLLMLTLTLLGTAVTTADASVPTSWCHGKSYKTVVKTYTRGSGHYPLRCGSSTWGFDHITHRWNATFDSKIALTIARGEDVSDLQQDGGSNIFALFTNKCVEIFRVIYNANAYRGNLVRPQGIITAYDESVGSTIAPDATPDYRTDCSVTQHI